MMEYDRALWIELKLIPELGDALFLSLLRRFGSIEKVFKASNQELSNVPKLKDSIQSDILSRKYATKADGITKRIDREGISLLTYIDPHYPNLLKEIALPPAYLFYKGDISLLEQPLMAIVGTREASIYSREMASKISRGFAELGVGVVSGMARGIDRAALEGSIEAGGRAIAILGSGIDIVYPPENRDLYMSLCNHGLILSQFLPGKDPEAYNFPNRNRIISGLCPGVVIVQAGKKSGAMITAQTAINENREVFVVPAPLGSFGFEGSNTLIDYGAKPVNTALEVIEEIKNFSVSKPKIRISKTKEISKDILHSSSELPLPEPSLPTDILPNEKKSILKALSKPQHIDYISEVTGISMSALHLLLIELMLDDYITEQPGKIFIRIK